MTDHTELAGRVAFITGAAHGQGRAMALALAAGGRRHRRAGRRRRALLPVLRAGHDGRARDPGRRDHEDRQADDPRASPTCAIRAAVQRAVDAAIAEFGRIDILINNAGIVAYAEVDTMTDAEWDAMIGINLTGPFVVTRAVVPHMKAAGRGVIVNNSSVMGLRGGNRLSHYVASKHGLTGLTKAWAIELAPHGIRVVSIHPTGVDTPMNDGLAAMEGATPQEIAERSAGNLLPGVPWIETSDVAELVLYLVSDRARYVTGAQFPLDAGLLTR